MRSDVASVDLSFLNRCTPCRYPIPLQFAILLRHAARVIGRVGEMDDALSNPMRLGVF